MLSDQEVKKLQDVLVNSKHPIFFFDDDPDGLCSFLLLYRKVREGKGVIVKSKPVLSEMFAQKAEDYHADAIFILDMPKVEQAFLDKVKAPAYWIDHHTPQKKEKVHYFNPQKHGKFVPTTYMAHQIVGQDLWIAAAGCVADWYIPDFLPEFEKAFPDLIENPYKTPPDILFNSKLGTLIRALSFNLKGSTKDALTSVKVLTRIESPEEILQQTTPQGKFIWKRYQHINDQYQALKKRALKKGIAEKGLFVFTYTADKMSLTSDLSNELLTIIPQKMIILAREKSGEMKCSLRSRHDGPDVSKVLEKALVGINGYGGGHTHACGANIPKEEFSQFLDNVRAELQK